MIPFFFRRYRKAPLATCVSFLATVCFIFAVFFSVGYFLNWEGLRDKGGSAGESLIVAAVSAVLGIAFWKLAAWLAKRKYEKLAEREAVSRPAPAARPSVAPNPTPRPTEIPRPATTGGLCPKCGAKPEPGDVYCIQCGAKLRD